MDRKIARRDFIKSASFIALSVQAVSLSAFGESSEYQPESDEAYIKIRSGDGVVSRYLGFAEHYHDLIIPKSAFDTPVEETITLRSQKTFRHTHRIRITGAQLQLVAQGHTVTLKDT